jgi:hypothetical protein
LQQLFKYFALQSIFQPNILPPSTFAATFQIFCFTINLSTKYTAPLNLCSNFSNILLCNQSFNQIYCLHQPLQQLSKYFALQSIFQPNKLPPSTFAAQLSKYFALQSIFQPNILPPSTFVATFQIFCIAINLSTKYTAPLKTGCKF